MEEKQYLDKDGLQYFLIQFKKYMDPEYIPNKQEQEFLERYLNTK